MDIIKRLKTYRLEHRLSQEALADKLGVAFCTLNRWERGHNRPSAIQKYHLEKFLANTKRRKK